MHRCWKFVRHLQHVNIEASNIIFQCYLLHPRVVLLVRRINKMIRLLVLRNKSHHSKIEKSKYCQYHKACGENIY